MQNKIIVGLTGPTGAGKSSLVSTARELGYFYIDADQVSRMVTAKGGIALPPLCTAFGEDILLPDGSLDRAKLAERAFSSPENTEKLNAITLPLIVGEIEKLIRATESRHILLDAPTLFESGADRLCHTTIGVLADAAIRLSRIMARDKITEEAALRRMKAGKPDDFYLKMCQHIVYNNASPADFLNAAGEILQKIKTESS